MATPLETIVGLTGRTLDPWGGFGVTQVIQISSPAWTNGTKTREVNQNSSPAWTHGTNLGLMVRV